MTQARKLSFLDRVLLDCGDGSSVPVVVLDVAPHYQLPGDVVVSYLVREGRGEAKRSCTMPANRLVAVAA